MKKTFITNMPDESGAFLRASRVIAQVGANITRVSYNRGVDAHLLFLDVAGTKEQLSAVSDALQAIGYNPDFETVASVLLLEFTLRDTPGSVLPILELIHGFNFNITYISSHENQTLYQHFRMGILVEDAQEVRAFLDQASRLCEVRIIVYDNSEKALDNTVFYISFVNQMSEKLSLDVEETQDLMVQSNLLMQQLDERNELPQKTFEYIGRFADILYQYRKEAFTPRVSRYQLKGSTVLFAIEPPCGSNTYLLKTDAGLIGIDSGFACYEEEMLSLFKKLVPTFDSIQKVVAVTHPDMDHAGLLHLFDTVYVTEETREHFLHEHNNEPNHRENNPAHAPYSRISRILSGYAPVSMQALVCFSEKKSSDLKQPLERITTLELMGHELDVYLSNGGHAKGEAVYVDELNKIVFCGDIMVNTKGFTPEQSAFNRLAPYLMTSVNMDSEKARLARTYLQECFDPEEYLYCCGHGAPFGGLLSPTSLY